MEEKGGNQQLIRIKNLNLIKRYIFQHSPISRVEIAQQLGLTTPTITGMVTPLIAQGLLREISAEARQDGIKTAGRPRVMLEYAPEALYICGVDMGPYCINYVLTDLCGNVVNSRRTAETMGDYDESFSTLVSGISDFLNECEFDRDKLLGIGICMPGLIDGSSGKIYNNFKTGWSEHDISSELAELFDVPVMIENNVRARAIAADLFDRQAVSVPFAYFYVTFGISCQMIVGDGVLYGRSAAAGEIGHTVVQRGGPVCPTCGNQGCLEAFAGERAVLQRCKEVMESNSGTVLHKLCASPDELTIEQVLTAQEMGDAAVGSIMEDVIEYLGIALANTINLVSPRCVVLDGRMICSPKNRELLLNAVNRNLFFVHIDETEFIILPFDPNRGARGAAAVVVREQLLNSANE